MCENVVRDGGEPCFSSVQCNLIYFVWEIFFHFLILFYFWGLGGDGRLLIPCDRVLCLASDNV